MLKQSFPLATADSRGGPVLPPLSTLPQWTRINNLSRLCPQRPLMKDRLQRVPDTRLSQKMSNRTAALDDGASDHDDAASVESAGTSKRRVHHLEHAIVFLQQQHDEILSALHNEVDRLKRENRDLQFRLTISESRNLCSAPSDKGMTAGSGAQSKTVITADDDAVHNAVTQSSCHHSARTSGSRRPGSRSKTDEHKVHNLESEVLELRTALKEAKHRNLLLEEQLEQAQHGTLVGSAAAASAMFVSAPCLPAVPRSETQRRSSELDSPSSSSHETSITASCSKLSSDDTNVAADTAQPQTLAECQELIRQLQADSVEQAHALNQLKLELDSAIHAHRWLPSNSYHVTKTCVPVGAASSQHQPHRVPHKPTTKKSTKVMSVQRDTVSLPSMTLTLGGKAVVRNSRSQKPVNRNQAEKEFLGSHNTFDVL